MKINSPLCITSRLLPGCQIGNAEISIEYSDKPTKDGRMRFHWIIDIAGSQGMEATFGGYDLQSGANGMSGTLQGGLETLLSSLSVFADACDFHDRYNKETENTDLFPSELRSWAINNSDDIEMICLELEEKSGELIIE